MRLISKNNDPADASSSKTIFVGQMGANWQVPRERMNFHSKILYPSVAVLALAACGSSSSTEKTAFVISPAEEALRIFAEDAGDVSDALTSDGALSARSVSLAANLETFAGEGANQLVEGSLIVQGDGDDLLVTFSTTDDPTPTAVRIEDAALLNENQIRIDIDGADGYFFDLFIGDGQTFADLFVTDAETVWAVPFGVFFSNNSDGFGVNGRGVIGSETSDMMMEQLAVDGGSVKYFGSANISFRQTDAGFNTFNGAIFGDVELDADFGTANISGMMDELEYEFGDGDGVTEDGLIDGAILFNGASLGPVNGFEGTLSADAELRAFDDNFANIADGLTYSGAFYGPDAVEVGGAIEGGPTTVLSEEGSGELIAHGYFFGRNED